MIQPFGHGQLQAGPEDAPGLTRQSAGCLAQQLEAGVGQQGMLGAGMLEGMADETFEALALDDRFQTQAHLNTAGQRRIGGTLQGLAQTYIAMGRIPEAVEKLEKAVRMVPDSAGLHFQLAKAYRLALEFSKAYNSYRKVVELAPESQLADEAERGAREVKALY